MKTGNLGSAKNIPVNSGLGANKKGREGQNSGKLHPNKQKRFGTGYSK
jgi:hypothetical protein